MRHLKTKLAISLMLLMPAMSWALPSDREQPINIEADHAQMDDQRGVTQYKGRAILTQGTLRIEGDVITFFYDAERNLEKAIAEGDLAYYEQVHKEGETPVKAKALQMEYHAGKQMIYLIGKGHVWQNNDEFTGNYIEYDIERDLVIANARPVVIGDTEQPSTGRVHITIQPPGRKPSTTAPTTAPTTPAPAPLVPAPEQSGEQSYPTGTTNTTLNVRTGPGTQYNRIAAFAPNTQVVIITRQGDWLQVRGIANEQVVIGWVSSRYIDAQN
ncbi:LptA-like protein [Methylophaga lonarensis MPL]|uniref:Lipopolysaccharide export system protein LptA n=1 Tax=Methylophaga lonarensis MPL TaxID=1286106 RepID=M7NY31_9GAMM|nr:lipopolysaccharide transport periplasmic protein LptA [Methylophaga lonarensis]EMR13713.1 LptA-like protein [Methylophaga lonarensis MPL]